MFYKMSQLTGFTLFSYQVQNDSMKFTLSLIRIQWTSAWITINYQTQKTIFCKKKQNNKRKKNRAEQKLKT